ncbi:UNVERIFIED_CONTAM: hypothetical protein NCL1_06163 [Trichonephila clavipes]
MCVGGLPMIVEIENGGMQKFWIDKTIGGIIIEVPTGMEDKRNHTHGFENKNRIDKNNRGFESRNEQYQFRNRGPSENFNQGDQRHSGRLNSLRV